MQSSILKVGFILVMMLALNFANAQNFEGEIIYEGKLIDQSKIVEKEDMDSESDSLRLSLKLIFQKDRYKMIFSARDSILSILVYNPQDKLVTEIRGLKNTVTHDARKNDDKFGDLVYLDQRELIHGIPCQTIRVKSEQASLAFSSDIIYFYNRNYFKINPQFFEHHEKYFLNHYARAVKVLPLKMRVNAGLFMIEYTMVDYKNRKVKSKEFDLKLNND